MGKWKYRNELQEYFDKIREDQDRQYVRGRNFGKVSFFDFKKAYKRDAFGFLLNGIILVCFSGAIFLMAVKSKMDFLEFFSSGSWLVFGVIAFFGCLCILAGVKVWRRAKK